MQLLVENKTKTMSISRSDFHTDIKAACTTSSDDIDSGKSFRFQNKTKTMSISRSDFQPDIKAASTTSSDDIDQGRSF